MKFKLYLLLALACAFSTPMYATDGNEKKPVVSGYIRDAQSGETLIGASVYVKEVKAGAITNLYGYYSLSLPAGDYTLVYSFIGYAPIEKKLTVKENITLNIDLNNDVHTLNEIVVKTDKANKNIVKPEMSVEKLQMITIKRIPALMGEVDLIKAIQLLPGVQSTSEGTSGFSVRGGGSDQNLILLDEATVYNASHLMGFFSVFNNDAVKDVKLYKGDIPATFGGRLSSVLDVRMKDGNNKNLSVSGGIGIISSRLSIEAPIIKDRTSFLIAGRRTYADMFLLLASDKDLRKSKLYFYDLNMKISHTFNDNNRLFLSGYMGRDVFGNNFAGMGFGNKTFSARWNHLFSKSLFANTTFIYSDYTYKLESNSDDASSYVWDSRLNDVSLKMDFNYFISTSNTLKFGFASTYHTFEPGAARRKTMSTEAPDGTEEASLIVPNNYALEHGIYISDQQDFGEHLTIKAGVRYSIFQNIGKGTLYTYNTSDPLKYVATDTTIYASGKIFHTYSGFEPRLGFVYTINDETSVKGSYSRTMQFVHLASNSTAGMPLDVWFPSTPNVKPQICDQYAIGVFRNFFDDQFETSIEAYYKKMDNVIDFRDNASLLLNPQMDGELRIGKAKAYGLEFLVRKSEGRLNGWISYTLSKTERKVAVINNGNWYNAPYDKPHSVSVVLNYEISKRVIISTNWVYASGTPTTFPTGAYNEGNVRIKIYSGRNEYRMPDYHRLDLSITLKGKERVGRLWHGEWNFSVYNAYNRHNAWSINFVEDENNKGTYKAQKIYLFGMIPSVSYNFYF